MKKLIILLILFPAIVFANPFLVCDPQDNVTHYEITWPDKSEDVPAQSDGSLKYDLSSVPIGINPIQVKAVKYTEKWGRIESTPVPFEFERPESPNAPSGVLLSRD